MTFDFSISNKVAITVFDQIDDIIDDAPEIYQTGAGCATASPTNFYSARESCVRNELLLDSEREEYHTLTARCLYVSKRGRPDIQTSIAFHCTRVRKPTRDGQRNLAAPSDI